MAPCPPGTDKNSCAFYSGASNGIGCDPAPPLGPNGTSVTTTFPQCYNLRGNAGRNLLNGPGLMNLDFSVFKNNPVKKISESFNVQFRAEFFNIINHANFGVPSIALNHTDIFDSTGAPLNTAGVLTFTSTDSREIQFALKLGW
jgi:hypothetical protein